MHCLKKYVQRNTFIKNLAGTKNCYIYATGSNVYTRAVLKTGNANWYLVYGTRVFLKFKLVPGTCFV